MNFNNIFENQIFSLHICLCTPKSIAFFEMWLFNANLNCKCTQNLRECPIFLHCALRSYILKKYEMPLESSPPSLICQCYPCRSSAIWEQTGCSIMSVSHTPNYALRTLVILNSGCAPRSILLSILISA